MNTRRSAGHAILALALFAAAALTLPAQTTHGSELNHAVAFQTGDTYFVGGDTITITSVRGTADTIAPGNLYEVKGAYKLLSHPGAHLSANVTTSSRGSTTGMKVNSVEINQGTGEFTVYFYMAGEGWPHISFYPTEGGNSFAGVYFGTGSSVMHNHAGVTDTVTNSASK